MPIPSPKVHGGTPVARDTFHSGCSSEEEPEANEANVDIEFLGEPDIQPVALEANQEPPGPTSSPARRRARRRLRWVGDGVF